LAYFDAGYVFVLVGQNTSILKHWPFPVALFVEVSLSSRQRLIYTALYP
jgi:hypothetical protein